MHLFAIIALAAAASAQESELASEAGTIVATSTNDIPLSDGGLSNEEADAASNLQACVGECDFDSQCAQGLQCFQRENGGPVPGCSGPGSGPYWETSSTPNMWDYCIPARDREYVRAFDSDSAGTQMAIVGASGPWCYGPDRSRRGHCCSGVTAAQCMVACDGVSGCNGFTWRESGDGGECCLKKVPAGEQFRVDRSGGNSTGWHPYFVVTQSLADCYRPSNHSTALRQTIGRSGVAVHPGIQGPITGLNVRYNRSEPDSEEIRSLYGRAHRMTSVRQNNLSTHITWHTPIIAPAATDVNTVTMGIVVNWGYLSYQPSRGFSLRAEGNAQQDELAFVIGGVSRTWQSASGLLQMKLILTWVGAGNHAGLCLITLPAAYIGASGRVQLTVTSRGSDSNRWLGIESNALGTVPTIQPDLAAEIERVNAATIGTRLALVDPTTAEIIPTEQAMTSCGWSFDRGTRLYGYCPGSPYIHRTGHVRTGLLHDYIVNCTVRSAESVNDVDPMAMVWWGGFPQGSVSYTFPLEPGYCRFRIKFADKPGTHAEWSDDDFYESSVRLSEQPSQPFGDQPVVWTQSRAEEPTCATMLSGAYTPGARLTLTETGILSLFWIELIPDGSAECDMLPAAPTALDCCGDCPVIDPCNNVTCSRDCGDQAGVDGAPSLCGWDVATSECRTGFNTTVAASEMMHESAPGDCSHWTSLPTSSPTGSPTSDPCLVNTCSSNCEGPVTAGGTSFQCGWDLETMTCRTGFVSTDAEIEAMHESFLGDCSHLTNAPSASAAGSNAASDESDGADFLLVVCLAIAGFVIVAIVVVGVVRRKSKSSPAPSPPAYIQSTSNQTSASMNPNPMYQGVDNRGVPC